MDANLAFHVAFFFSMSDLFLLGNNSNKHANNSFLSLTAYHVTRQNAKHFQHCNFYLSQLYMVDIHYSCFMDKETEAKRNRRHAYFKVLLKNVTLAMPPYLNYT